MNPLSRLIIPVLVLVVLGVTACGSSNSTSAPGRSQAPAAQSATPTASAVSPSPSTTTYAPAYPPAAIGVAEDSSGDKAELDIFIGPAKPLTNLSASSETTCGTDTSPFDYQPNLAVAIPVEIDAYLDSDLSTQFGVDFPTQEVYPGGNMQSEGNPPVWIQDTNSTGDCSGGAGSVLWSNLAPHNPVSWTGYIVLPLAITPDDPSGLDIANRELLEMPTINFNMSDATWHLKTPQSHGLVDCSGAEPPTMIAVDVTTATQSGCTGRV